MGSLARGRTCALGLRWARTSSRNRSGRRSPGDLRITRARRVNAFQTRLNRNLFDHPPGGVSCGPSTRRSAFVSGGAVAQRPMVQSPSDRWFSRRASGARVAKARNACFAHRGVARQDGARANSHVSQARETAYNPAYGEPQGLPRSRPHSARPLRAVEAESLTSPRTTNARGRSMSSRARPTSGTAPRRRSASSAS